MTSLEILPHKSRALARHPHPPRPSLIWIVDLPRAGREAGAAAADNLLLEAALVRLEARKDVGRGGAPLDGRRAAHVVVRAQALHGRDGGRLREEPAVGSAVVGYYVEMGLDAMHEALAEEAEEEDEEEPEAKRQ